MSLNPLLPTNHFKRTKILLPSCTDVSACIFSKQLAETSVHRATHPTVTKMTIVKLCFNVLLHIFTKQFENNILYGKVIAIAKLILFA